MRLRSSSITPDFASVIEPVRFAPASFSMLFPKSLWGGLQLVSENVTHVLCCAVAGRGSDILDGVIRADEQSFGQFNPQRHDLFIDGPAAKGAELFFQLAAIAADMLHHIRNANRFSAMLGDVAHRPANGLVSHRIDIR